MDTLAGDFLRPPRPSTPRSISAQECERERERERGMDRVECSLEHSGIEHVSDSLGSAAAASLHLVRTLIDLVRALITFSSGPNQL